MTLRDIVTILVPVLVALVSGLYAYLQTRKTTGVEGQKLSLAGYESLNKGLTTEIDRLRTDRTEDQRSAAERQTADQNEISELRRKLSETTRKCESQGEKFSDLVVWSRKVARILNDPNILRVLEASDVHVPQPPTWADGP